jgi:hypothetical protein
MESDISDVGRAKLAELRRKDQTGKTGLLAKAAKGPYTIIYETGETYTAGSMPELVKLTSIKQPTISARLQKNPNKFMKGWKVFKGKLPSKD